MRVARATHSLPESVLPFKRFFLSCKLPIIQPQWEDSHLKSGVHVGRELLRNTNIPYCGRGLNMYSAQYPKTYWKSSNCGPFETEHSNMYHNRFFNPTNIPVLFTWTSSPPVSNNYHRPLPATSVKKSLFWLYSRVKNIFSGQYGEDVGFRLRFTRSVLC